jgi:hypothetical protein
MEAAFRDLNLAQNGMLRLSRSGSAGSEFRIQFPLRVFLILSTAIESEWQDIAAPQSL